MSVRGDNLHMIAHLDVDCFFAQVEEVRLSLRGRALGVQQNMEIAALNYEARARGLYNRISVEEGLRKCPDLVLVRGDNGVNGMQRYRSAGQAVLRCVLRSLDDAAVPTAPLSRAEDAAAAPNWIGRPVEHASFDDFFVQLPERLASADAAIAWGDANLRVFVSFPVVTCVCQAKSCVLPSFAPADCAAPSASRAPNCFQFSRRSVQSPMVFIAAAVRRKSASC
jgi:nucleotidyltransferase/DNA polymerase involved in DNA repair